MQNYLLCDEDIGGRKSEKARELGFVISHKYMFILLHFLTSLFSSIDIPAACFIGYSTAFLTEDGLFDKIRASNKSKVTAREESKKPMDKVVAPLPKKSPQKIETKSTPP